MFFLRYSPSILSLMVAATAVAQRPITFDYWQSHPRYFLTRSGLLQDIFGPERYRCDVGRAGKALSFVDCCNSNSEVLASPSGRYVCLTGVVPRAKNPHPGDAVPYTEYPCRQVSVESPCDGVLGVIDTQQCRIISLVNIRLRTFSLGGGVNYFFSDDDSLLFVSDDKLRVFNGPRFDRTLAEYAVTLGDLRDELGAVKKIFDCFESGFCTVLTKQGWIVFDKRSWRLVTKDAAVAEFPGLQHEVVLSWKMAETAASVAEKHEEGEVLRLINPVYADDHVWVQETVTSVRKKGLPTRERAFLVSTRDYDKQHYAVTELPAEASEVVVSKTISGRLECRFRAPSATRTLEVQIPDSSSPAKTKR